jgi:uncharacterized membrane protein YccC
VDAGVRARIIASFRVALHYALVALVAYFAAYFLTGVFNITSHFAPVGALWAMIVGISVVQATGSETVTKARTQILGGMAGALATFIYLEALPVNPVGMVLLIGLIVFFCQVMEWPEYSVSAGLTVGVILFFSQVNPELPPVMNVSLRFIEVVIGSITAVLVVQLISSVEKGSF